MARKKILLVDDTETVLLIEKMILNKSYDLVTARNGEEAIATAIAERPDLILLDVIMPRMGGLEACRLIKQRPGISRIPIIMVTTRSELHNVETAFRNGCADYVTKPIDSVELLTKVRNCVGE
ncbi:MAG TPA: response regulator [Blastocatellia bacterium]|nr:response regulator [Blastocatellia bacterium]